MSLKGRFRHSKIDLFSDSSASLHLPCMITLSRTASCCYDSLLETLHRFIGSWLSPSSTNYWSEETVCRAQIHPICSVDLILFLINTFKSVSAECQKRQEMISLNILLQHMMLFHIIMETWHLDMAIFFFLLLLFILWLAAILNSLQIKCWGFALLSFYFFSSILISFP